MSDSNLLDAVLGKSPEPSVVKEETIDKTEEKPLGDAPVEETKTEEKPVEEKPTETVAEENKEQAKVEEPQAPNPIEFINKELGTEFKEPIEIKSALDKAKTLEVEIQTWQDKYKQLEETVLETQDPLSYFANEDEYKRQQLLKTNPDLNASELNNLFKSDVKKLEPIEALELSMAIENPELSRDQIAEHIKKKFDYDPEVDTKLSADIILASKEAKSKLDQLKTSVETPKKVDIVAMKEQKQKEFEQTINKNKADLEPIVNKLAESITDLELFDGSFKFQIEPEAKAEASKQMLDYLIDTGAKIDDNTEKYLGGARDTYLTNYFIKNHKRIMVAYADQKVAEKDEEWKSKVHNPKPIDEPAPPAPGSRPDTDLTKVVSS